METLTKVLVFGAAALVATVAAALEWWQYRQVPASYSTYGQRRPRSD